ncbi:acyltransferase family protein [Mariniflexile sp.]|uniref:acyltransferase family protein n=1 Tax=Mariniflexile sp. TaxID=1979402 RepID=UPI0040482658
MNGLYDSLTVIFIFPLIIYIGANGKNKSKLTNKICAFLGDISYPLYIIHFPFIYLYCAWVFDNNITISQGIWVGTGLLIGTLLLSYLSLRL